MYRPTTIRFEPVSGWQRVYRLINSLTAVIMIIALRSAVAAPADLDKVDLARLKRGEILLQTIHGDKPGGAARVTAYFNTTTEAIWNVIGYCKYEFVYVRGLQLCEVLEPGQLKTRVRHRLRNNWFSPTLDYTFEASRTPCCRGEFRLVEGDLDVMEGQWVLQPVADSNGIIVVHEIRVKPGLPAPRWLVRRSLRRDLPDMLACMRGLANASGDEPRNAADLNRCPGDIPEVVK